MPTRTQANSYLIPTRTQTISYLLPTRTLTNSYPIPTRTQLYVMIIQDQTSQYILLTIDCVAYYIYYSSLFCCWILLHLPWLNLLLFVFCMIDLCDLLNMLWPNCYTVLCSCSYDTLHNNSNSILAWVRVGIGYDLVRVRVGSRYELVKVRVGIRYELAWVRVGMVWLG